MTKICFPVSVETPDVTCYLLSRGVAGCDPPGPASCQPWWAVLGRARGLASQHLGWEGKRVPKEMVSPRTREITGLEKGCSPTSQVSKQARPGGGTCLKPSRPAAGHISKWDRAVGLSPEVCGQHFRACVSAGTWPQSGSVDPTAIS